MSSDLPIVVPSAELFFVLIGTHHLIPVYGERRWDDASMQAVYTALKETESRATDLLPLWKLGPLATALVPRQVQPCI